MQRNATNAMIRSAFEAQRQTLGKWCNELVTEGFTKTNYEVTNIRWDDMARYSSNGSMSCWGPDIADTSSHLRRKGSFVLVDTQEKIADAALASALERTRNLKKDTSIPLPRTDGKVDYAYKSRGQVKVMTHEGVKVHCQEGQMWIAQGGGPIVKEAADLAYRCTIDDNAKRFERSGRMVWILPRCADTVWLVNYLQDTMVLCEKKKVLFYGHPGQELYGNTLQRIETLEDTEEGGVVYDVVRTHTHGLVVLNYKGGNARVKYCQGEDIPLFAIRSPNMVERVSKVSLDRVKVSDGTKMVTLADMASNAGTYAEQYGLGKDVSLMSPSDKDMVNTIRMQVSIVPASVDGEATEVYEKIYDYRTYDDKRPTALYSYHTSFGTSFASSGPHAIKIQPCMHDGHSLSAFNLRVEASKKHAGDDATYTASENRENLDAGFGMAIPLGPIGFPKVANATLLTQWPVCSTRPVYDTDFPVYRSLSIQEDQTRGLYASKMGLGSYEGEGRGIKTPDLRRRTESNPTMTYTRFYSLDAPVDSGTGLYTITKEQLKGIIKMMDEMYELAGNAHLLTDKEAVSVVPLERPASAKRAHSGYTFPMID